jgi:hypothetical protein
VSQEDKPFADYSVFRTSSGKHAVVVLNDQLHPITVSVKVEGTQDYVAATPESPEAKPSTGALTVASRSAVVLMQK